MADITLSSATRSNLLSLQRTTSLIDQTQERLSTGKKVNSAIDDALAFFKARSFDNRASDLATIKNNILEGINIIETAVKSLESAEDILKQMQATAEAAKAVSGTTQTDKDERKELAADFDELRDQLAYLMEDADYNGVNLIATSGSTLTVTFSEQCDARKMTITGELLTPGKSDGSTGLKIQSAGNATLTDWTNVTSVSTSLSEIDTALDTVRDKARELGSKAALMEIRNEFTDNMINTLESGSAQLVNADINSESANMLSLQTRQQLGTISLSIAQSSEQSVLRLF